MQTEWQSKPLLYKIVSVASIVVGIAIIVLAVLQLFDVWSTAGYVYVPLMGINLMLQAYSQWKPNRGIAIFNLCAAAFILVCAVAVFILK